MFLWTHKTQPAEAQQPSPRDIAMQQAECLSLQQLRRCIDECNYGWSKLPLAKRDYEQLYINRIAGVQ